jgi:CopG family nickel-responsive transcriptional regulator
LTVEPGGCSRIPPLQRFTISLDDELAAQFDGLIASKGYVNRSEAVRDLIWMGLGRERLITPDPAAPHAWCVAHVSPWLGGSP